MNEILSEKLERLSVKPGVYLMKDEKGEIIYVGKAKNLKKRVGSYFNRPAHSDLKTSMLVSKIRDLDTIITGSEQEALILESTLIKRHRPRYNVILKDGKRYPSLRINFHEPYPYIAIVRKIEEDGALYFGPYASSSAVHGTLKMINKTFKLRKCRGNSYLNRKRPCLNHQMGACLGLCCVDVSEEKYAEVVREVVLFLKGRAPDLVGKIRKEMISAAETQQFELAAELRDKLFAIEKTLEKQVAVTTDLMDRDVIALHRTQECSLVTVLFVRGGFLQGTRHFEFSEIMATDGELLGSFVQQYYEKTHFVPGQILVSEEIPDAELRQERLREV